MRAFAGVGLRKGVKYKVLIEDGDRKTNDGILRADAGGQMTEMVRRTNA